MHILWLRTAIQYSRLSSKVGTRRSTSGLVQRFFSIFLISGPVLSCFLSIEMKFMSHNLKFKSDKISSGYRDENRNNLIKATKIMKEKSSVCT